MILRSVLAVFCGLVLMSLIAEPIEFLVVSLSGGKMTTDQSEYFQLRNRTPILMAKFAYNGLSAFIGGIVVAKLASRQPVLHGHVLAIVQSTLFVWGMTMSEFAGTTPKWFWIPAVPLMYVCNVLGAIFYARQTTNDNQQEIRSA